MNRALVHQPLHLGAGYPNQPAQLDHPYLALQNPPADAGIGDAQRVRKLLRGQQLALDGRRGGNAGDLTQGACPPVVTARLRHLAPKPLDLGDQRRYVCFQELECQYSAILCKSEGRQRERK